MFRAIRNWLDRQRAAQAEAAGERDVVVTRDMPRRSKPFRAWTGEGSVTESQILYHLQFGPMTRQQLNELLDVTTASIHLPKMVDRHQIRIIEGSWPFRYELVRQDQIHEQAADDSAPKVWQAQE